VECYTPGLIVHIDASTKVALRRNIVTMSRAKDSKVQSRISGSITSDEFPSDTAPEIGR
jgi:hypothetical protein